MIYQETLAGFSLSSTWRCNFVVNSGRLQWYIVDTPTASSKSVIFPVSLPEGIVVSRSWLSMTLSSPNSGAAYKRVNEMSIPSSGIVELEGITSETTSYEAVFTFRANGKVYENTQTHSGVLTISDLTLNVQYETGNEEDGGSDLPDSAPDEETQPELSRAAAGLQLPRLLDKDMREIARLHPATASLTLNLDRLSTAELTLAWDAPDIRVRDCMELFNPSGSVGVFRAYEVQTNCGMSRTVYLEHALSTLSDDLAIGTQAMSGPVRTVFTTLLEGQTVPMWQMGECAVPDDVELVYEYRNDNLLTAVMELTSMLPDTYFWDYDFTTAPWTMNLREIANDDWCECRLNRNLNTVVLNVDASSLCTRVIPYGAGEGVDRISLTSLIGVNYLDSETQDTWGLVTRTITAENIFDALMLKDVAERYLERHQSPSVSVEIGSIDIYHATGETIDRFQLGRLCLLALPAYATTMKERVISIRYPNLYQNPEMAELTLANRIRTASDEIAELMRDATNSKLIGGTVASSDKKSFYGEVYPDSPLAQYIDIEEYGNVLSVRVRYEATVNYTGASVSCTIRVDGNVVPADEVVNHTVDILRYLAADENGVPTVGQHTISYYPITLNDNDCSVSATATIKTIERR